MVHVIGKKLRVVDAYFRNCSRSPYRLPVLLLWTKRSKPPLTTAQTAFESHGSCLQQTSAHGSQLLKVNRDHVGGEWLGFLEASHVFSR